MVFCTIMRDRPKPYGSECVKYFNAISEKNYVKRSIFFFFFWLFSILKMRLAIISIIIIFSYKTEHLHA